MGQGQSALQRNGGAGATARALDTTAKTIQKVMDDLRALKIRMGSAKDSLMRRPGQALQGGDLRSKLAYVDAKMGESPGTASQIMNAIGMTPSEANESTKEELYQVISSLGDAQGGGGRRRSKTSCGRVRSRRGRNHSRKRRN